jgi:uncharacterized protein involved in exopolysaccharide biosynthesis
VHERNSPYTTQKSTSDDTKASSVPKRRLPLKSQRLGGYWRVPVFALAAGLIAFSASFVVQSQYPSVSRMLIRTGETSYSSTDSAETLGGGGINIGGIDITKQQTLGNTLIALALSKQSAAEVVDRIGVEKINGGEEPSLSMTTKIVNFFKVGGTGTAPTATEAAIDRVQGSLEAVVLDESWVMEITAWDPDPELAREMANVTADVAVDQSSQRFKENSVRELEYLSGPVEAARAGVTAKAKAIADFKSANNIIAETGSGPLAGGLTPSSSASLEQLNGQLAGLRAREQLLQQQFSDTPQTLTTETQQADGSITRQQESNPDYDKAQQALESVQADIAASEAQFNELAGRLGGGSAPSINEIQVKLAALQSELDLAQENYKSLNDHYNAVAVTVEKPRFDASRLGPASVPTTPGRPLRYLFLLVGALVGALGGLLLTWFRSIREEDEAVGALQVSEGGRNTERSASGPPIGAQVVDVTGSAAAGADDDADTDDQRRATERSTPVVDVQPRP